MYENLEIGPVPANERCEQLGPNYRPARARLECRTFIELIRRTVGEEPDGAFLIVFPNRHDFGTYFEVAVRYDPENEAALAYAFRVDAEAPSEWDEEARAALARPDQSSARSDQ